jgi:zinc protease
MSSSGSLARLIAGRVIFGEHPYGIPLGGTSESIETLQLHDLRAVLKDRMFPRGSSLILVGDLSPNEGFAYARTVFADWRKVAAYAPADVPSVPDVPARRILVDLPDSGRSAVIIGKRAPARSDPRYLAATVLNGLLSGYSGRLNREIRVKRGLSYGAGAGFHARRLAGSMLASTMVEHARVGETIAVIGDVFADVAANAPSEEELQTRKATLRGAFGRTLETVGGLAGMVGSRVIYDLPADELETYLARLEAITPQEVVAVAAEFLAGGALQIIVVGDAAAVKAGAPGIDFEEYAADAIELRHASLLQEEL